MAAPMEEQVVAALRSLPPHQKQEVLDFAQFLSTKSAESRDRSSAEESRSALEIAQQWVGCIEDSPEDLSDNKAHLDEYGGQCCRTPLAILTR